MTEALIYGLIVGFLVNVPVGPINAAAISRTLRDRFSAGLAIGVGAAVMDVAYCSAAMFGVSFAGQNILIVFLFQLAAFAVMIVTGIASLKGIQTLERMEMREQKVEARVQKRFGLHGPFLMGVLMYLASPTFLPFWIFVSGFLQGHGYLEASTPNNIAFSAAVGAGSIVWFHSLLTVVSRYKSRLSYAIVNGINRFAGAALLGFGTYLGYRILLFTNWASLLRALAIAV